MTGVDPAVFSQALLVVLALVVAVGSRFTDVGRKRARRLRVAVREREQYEEELSMTRRQIIRHNVVCPGDGIELRTWKGTGDERDDDAA